jgi:hypothetical protein
MRTTGRNINQISGNQEAGKEDMACANSFGML